MSYLKESVSTSGRRNFRQALVQASVRCLGKGGKLLEIGKADILRGTSLSMRPLLQNVQFIGIDLDRVVTSSDGREVCPCAAFPPLTTAFQKSTKPSHALAQNPSF